MVSLSKFLMSPAQVLGVINSLNKQIINFTNQVTTPFDNIINQVDGGAWKGDGATRFIEEMKSLVRPQLINLWTIIHHTGDQVHNARVIMQNSDNQAGKIAGALMDQFKGIYH